MTVKKFYENIHGDYNDLLTRLPTDALALRFIRQFPSDPSYSELMEAVRKDDITASFEAAHKLKGLAATLSFSQLFAAVNVLSEQLRPKTTVADTALVQKVSESYHIILREIHCLEDGGCMQ